MADEFIARVKAQLDTSDIESKWAATKAKLEQPIKIKIDSSEFQKAANGNSSYLSNAGAKAGKQYSKAFSQSVSTNNISKIKNDLLDGKFLLRSSSMSKSLRPFSGQDNELLKQARLYEKIYNNAFSNIQKHFNPQDSFKLNDKILIKSYKNMETAAKRFGNTIQAVSNETSGIVSTFEASTSSNQTLNWLNNNTKAVKKYGDALKTLAEKQKNVTERSDVQGLQSQVNDIKSKAAVI